MTIGGHARVVALDPHPGVDFIYEDEALLPIGARIERVEIEGDDFTSLVDTDVLVPFRHSATRAVIDRLDRCRMIASMGIGVDHIDVSAATERGILVTNMGDVFVEEVANHTWMLLLLVARRGLWLHEMTVAGRWRDAHAELFPVLKQFMPRLTGQTLGLVSFGRIARAVARRGQAFGMSVVAYDPYVPTTVFADHGVERMDLNELCARSDVVSSHLPLTDETFHLIGATQFQRMKPGCIFISIGRGRVVDEPALIEALIDGRLGGAGIDVFEQEPPDATNPLLHLPNVAVSPHMASVSNVSTVERRRMVGRQAATALQGRVPAGVVNPQTIAAWQSRFGLGDVREP